MCVSYLRLSEGIWCSLGGKAGPFRKTDPDTRHRSERTSWSDHQRPAVPLHYVPSETHSSSFSWGQSLAGFRWNHRRYNNGSCGFNTMWSVLWSATAGLRRNDIKASLTLKLTLKNTKTVQMFTAYCTLYTVYCLLFLTVCETVCVLQQLLLFLANVEWTFHFIVLQTLWERYFWMFWNNNNIQKTLHECPVYKCFCANVLRTLLKTRDLWTNVLLMLLEELYS